MSEAGTPFGVAVGRLAAAAPDRPAITHEDRTIWTSRPERTVAPLPCAGPLVRISAGLEDAADLIDDLQDGFERMRAYGALGA